MWQLMRFSGPGLVSKIFPEAVFVTVSCHWIIIAPEGISTATHDSRYFMTIDRSVSFTEHKNQIAQFERAWETLYSILNIWIVVAALA